MNLKNARILVTGADGFIGSHLTEYLLKKGHSVRAFTFYNSFNSWGWLDELPERLLSRLEVHSGDVRDAQNVAEAVRGCDVVFHLAALISIPYSYRAAESFVETNVMGTLNVLEAARHAKIAKLVHTSTSEVYGSARFVPITEEHPLNAQSPYAASKIGADQMALSYHRTFGLPVAILRPFNTYGPRQSSRAVIPTVITQIASGKKEIRLGSEHPTRDFSFVLDTVRAFIAVAESEEATGQVLNGGSGFEISIGETARLIAQVMGKKLRIATQKERIRPAESEVERLWADTGRLRDVTAWEPKYGGKKGFEKGLLETVRWFTQKENLKKYKPDLFNI